MNNLIRAKELLRRHLLVLVADNDELVFDDKGIKALMSLVSENKNLENYVAADVIVGKAAAMLFVKLGVKEVYALTLSKKGKEVFDRYHIKYQYKELIDQIINRTKDDICPMEKTLLDIDDIEEGYLALKKKLEELKR